MNASRENWQSGTLGSWLNPSVSSPTGRLLSSKLIELFGKFDFVESFGLWRYQGNQANLDTIALHSHANKIPKGIIVPKNESITKRILDLDKTLCLNLWDDVDMSTPRHLMTVRNCGWERIYFLPMRSGRRWLGSVLLATAREEHLRPSILERLQLQCDYYATYADCILAHSELHSLRKKLALENRKFSALKGIESHFSTEICGSDEGVRKVVSALRKEMRAEYVTLWKITSHPRSLECSAGEYGQNEYLDGSKVTISDRQFHQIFSLESQPDWSEEKETLSSIILQQMNVEGIKSARLFPLFLQGQVVGMLHVGSKRPAFFSNRLASDTLSALADCLALAYGGAISTTPSPLTQSPSLPLPLPGSARTHPGRRESQIVGESPATRHVLEKIEVVSGTMASVLLLGETGTGKELFANRLHLTSGRAGGPFIAVNCAAIPSGLAESELFGHERGAFTGALSSRIGYFEQANGGTLFLDEIGDIPLDLQAKLLRVLQEQAIRRVGGTKSIKIDVRIVSATHRDLEAMIADGQFREDLFYRLSVFPISVPPLRERREDIPLLVRYFTDKVCRQLRKPALSVNPQDAEALAACEWRGNIRELENFVERAVICSRGRELEIRELVDRSPSTGAKTPSADARTWEDIERDTIISALRTTKGKIAGENGAARLLSLKRTTLNSKINRLGIKISDIRKKFPS